MLRIIKRALTISGEARSLGFRNILLRVKNLSDRVNKLLRDLALVGGDLFLAPSNKVGDIESL